MNKEAGERIKSARLERKISQEGLAEMLGISQSAMAKIENGKTRVNLERLVQIAKQLKAEPQDLMPSESIAQFNNKNAYGYMEVLVQTREELDQERKSHIAHLTEELRKAHEQNAMLMEMLKRKG